MKRKLVSLALILVLILAMAPAASAAALSYPAAGGNIYFDAAAGAITGCDETVTAAEIPTEIYGVTVTSIGSKAFSKCGSLTSVTIPDTVTSIGSTAFSYCTSLTSVVIPDSVTALGAGAFSHCHSLSHVTLSRGLTEIPDNAFIYCGALTSISIPNSVTEIGQWAFRSSGLTSITLPDSVRELGRAALSDCPNLTDVDLGSAAYAGSSLLEKCPRLSRVTLSPAMASVPNLMFDQCPALEELVIPEGVTTLGEMLFFRCDGLRTITLPSTLQTVKSAAFNDCVNLTDVYYNGTPMEWACVQVKGTNNPLLAANIHFSEPVAGFTDVSSGDYYGEAVAWAVNAGITTGTSANTFSPEMTVTRAQAVTFLWRAAGSPEPASAASPFTDVADPSAYYYKAVLWAAEQGITKGVSAAIFGTDHAVAYDQMLAFLARAAGAETGSGDWSQAAIDWGADTGLTAGLTFSAKDACPRSDVVYCLWRQLA